MTTTPTQFRFSIDRGGTFTDIYAEVPRLNNQPARVITLKLLSKNPNSYTSTHPVKAFSSANEAATLASNTK